MKRRLILAAVLGLAAVATWHYWTLYSDLQGARNNLLATQTQLHGGLDVQANDLAQARTRIDKAHDQVADARRHLAFDPTFQLAHVVPGLSGQAHAVDDFVEMADLLTRIGQSAADAGDKALTLRDAPPKGQPLTTSLVALLTDVKPDIDAVAQLTQKLVARRQALGDRALVPPLASVRERLDRELPNIANTVEQLQQSQELIPAFLGFKGPRRYMILALNNGEMMPGGGFLSAAGVLAVTDGVNGPMDFSDSTDWKGKWEARGGQYIKPPGPLQRYLLKDFGWNLSTSNWDPDFTNSAQQSLEFYEMVHGEQHVNGVIAVDLVVLQELLKVTGPKTIPVEGHGNVTFDSNNAILTLEALTRQPSDPLQDRKSVIGDLAERVIADLLKLPSAQWAQAIEVIRTLGAERHIQVFAFNPREQTMVRDAGWSGRLEPATGDYLMFNESSLNSTKLNLLIQPEGDYTIEVSPLGDAHHELLLRYRNPFFEWSKGKDPALVTQLMLGGLYGGYLQIIAPQSMIPGGMRMNGQAEIIEDAGAAGDRLWFGSFMSLPPGQEAQVALRWTVLLASADKDRYELYLQKQAGTPGLCLNLRVTRNGSAARQVTVSGGTRDAGGRVCLTSDVRVRAEF